MYFSQNRKLMPKFVLKDMEGLFIEEMNIAVSTLRNNLESLPVQQGGKSENSTLTRKMRWINTPRYDWFVKLKSVVGSDKRLSINHVTLFGPFLDPLVIVFAWVTFCSTHCKSELNGFTEKAWV